MNVISLSLWGNDPKYCDGALAWASKPPEGWIVRVVIDGSVPFHYASKLPTQAFSGPPCVNPMMWRFFALDEPWVERVLVRDCDSRWTEREAVAVREWVASGLPFCVLRDHPRHDKAVMGGLWGAVAGAFGRPMRELAAESPQAFGATGGRDAIYGLDQLWLERVAWPIMQAKGVFQRDLCHADKFGGQQWPCKAGDDRFCGEVIGADGKPRDYDWMMRRNWQTQEAP